MDDDYELYTIEIPLEPFELDGETVSTALHLDIVDLQQKRPSHLANTTFEFPINPEDGYIDGSIYVRSAHSPIDVTKIVFLRLRRRIYKGSSDRAYSLRI